MIVSIEQDTKKNKVPDKHVIIYSDNQTRIALHNVVTEIPEEKHVHMTQFMRVERGVGTLYLDNKFYKLYYGIAVYIPPGTRHRIINEGGKNMPLQIYLVYGKDKNKNWEN